MARERSVSWESHSGCPRGAGSRARQNGRDPGRIQRARAAADVQALLDRAGEGRRKEQVSSLTSVLAERLASTGRFPGSKTKVIESMLPTQLGQGEELRYTASMLREEC